MSRLAVVGEGWRLHRRAGLATLTLCATLFMVATVQSSCTSLDSSPPPGAGRQNAIADGNRIMILGDSISQGLEGDFTWRYRLFQHFDANNVKMTFVGPWTGTATLPPSQPAGYPQISAPPVHDGAYRPGISFPSANLAQWGWTVKQAKNVVGPAAQKYQPDYMMIELGFNDLAFDLAGPANLTEELHTLIARIQRVRPSIKIIVANVIHGEPSGAPEILRAQIREYNSALSAQAASWSTAESPVTLADIAGVYEPATDSYDGLHPNIAGEIKIAEVFADILSSRYRIGPQFRAPLAAANEIEPPTPRSIKAISVKGRIRVTWSHSFGVEGYILYSRDLTSGQRFQKAPLPLAADSWTFGDLISGHTYQYQISAARGTHESDLSPIATAVAG